MTQPVTSLDNSFKEPLKTSFSVSAQDFAYMDGVNTPLFNVDCRVGNSKGHIGVAPGYSTDFDSKDNAILDVNGGYNYNKNATLNQNIRIRTVYNLKNDDITTQIRYSPLTGKKPITPTTTAYVNPHYVGKYNYNTKEWTNGAGCFVGVTQKFGSNLSLSAEAQRYNLQNIKDNSGKNWSFNTILTYKLF